MPFKYVNMSSDVVRLPTKSGGRCALRPGEYLTDPYYERVARNPEEPPGNGKSLVRIPLDQNPMDYMTGQAHINVFPEIHERGRILEELPSACQTTCENACMSVAETQPSTVSDDVNSIIDTVTKTVVPVETKTSTIEEVTIEGPPEKKIETDVVPILEKHGLAIQNLLMDSGSVLHVKDGRKRRFISKKADYPVFHNYAEARAHADK
jgi:hypothetical protein